MSRMPPRQGPEFVAPADSTPSNRRQWPRYRLAQRERFTITTDGRTGTCHIEDISLGGARLRVAGEIPPNPELRIEHPRLGRADARRCWTTPNHVGVVFDHTERSLTFIAHCLAEGVDSSDAEPAA